MWFVVLRLFLRAFWSTHFCTIFRGFEGVLGVTVVGCTTAKRACTTENRATIRARKKADGTVSDTVQIRLEKNGALVYQEAQTFARKQAAQAWVKRRKTGLVEWLSLRCLCRCRWTRAVVGHRPIRACPPVVHSDANDGLSANQATANSLNASAEGVSG